VVDRDDAVERRVEDRAAARVALLELDLGLTVPPPLLAVLEHPIDDEPEPREVRLEHDVARARAQRLDRRLLADRAREDHEGDVGAGRVHDRLRLARREPGQVVVAERDVPRPVGERLAQCGRRPHTARSHLVAVPAQLVLDELRVLLGVLDQQQVQRGLGHDGAGHRQGTVWGTVRGGGSFSSTQ
jgi:hypothetical protein